MHKEEHFRELMEKMYQFSRIFNNYNKKPKAFGTEDKLFMSETHILDYINNNQGITIKDIATTFGITNSGACQQINKLESKELIIKKRNDTEYRVKDLHTTDKGKIVCDNHRNYDTIIESRLLDNLNDFDIEDFDKCIFIINSIIEDLKIYHNEDFL